MAVGRPASDISAQRFKLRHYRKAPARDELGARAQGGAAEMLESVSTDSRHYPQVRGVLA
jgi:hypothetical protein